MKRIDCHAWQEAEDIKTWWDAWLSEAEKATGEIILVWETRGAITEKDFRSEIWSKLKTKLLEHCFHNKCAYCEIDISLARQSGHQEHFRPKLAVNYRRTIRKGFEKAKTVDHTSTPITHPGYFWLAYNWKNLLPSCERCNTGRGKRNQFPLIDPTGYVFLKKLSEAEKAELKHQPISSTSWPGFYYLDPEDLDVLEKRCILHPYFDDPHEHICFGPGGIETAREGADGQPSEMGRHSIEVLDLGNSNLRRARHRAQASALLRYSAAYLEAAVQDLEPDECRRQAWARLADVREGRSEYAAAVFDYLRLQHGDPPDNGPAEQAQRRGSRVGVIQPASPDGVISSGGLHTQAVP